MLRTIEELLRSHLVRHPPKLSPPSGVMVGGVDADADRMLVDHWVDTSKRQLATLGATGGLCVDPQHKRRELRFEFRKLHLQPVPVACYSSSGHIDGSSTIGRIEGLENLGCD